MPHQPTKVIEEPGGVLVQVSLDSEGKAWVPLGRYKWSQFITLFLHADRFPGEEGYAPKPNVVWTAQQRDNHPLIVLYGKPGQRVAFHVRVHD